MNDPASTTASTREAPPGRTHFRSLEHPGGLSRRWTFARRLVGPLATCFLPLMIGALVAVLQTYDALPFLTIGFPLALALAAAWTFYRMHATPAEVFVRPGTAAVRSVWAAAEPERGLHWRPIYELRFDPSTITAGIGDAAIEFDRRFWPDADALLTALHAARDA